MGLFAPKTKAEIQRDMAIRAVARSDLSDITESGSVKALISSVASEIAQAYLQAESVKGYFSLRSARGAALDARAKDYPEPVGSRRGPKRAITQVVLSRQGTTGTAIADAGVVVSTPEGVAFRLLLPAQVDATSPAQIAGHVTGQDAAPVSAIALSPGSAGNVSAGAVSRFAVKPSGFESVTNVSSGSSGRDRETDDEWRERILAYEDSLARCHETAIEHAARGVELESGQRVVFAHAVRDFEVHGQGVLYVDDGAGTAEATESITGELVTDGLAGPGGTSAVGGEEYLWLDYAAIKNEAGFTLTSSTRGVLTYGSDYSLDPSTGQIRFSPALVNGEEVEADYTRFTGLLLEVQKVITGDRSDRVNYPGFRAFSGRVSVRAPTVVVPSVDVTLIVSGRDKSSTSSEVSSVIQRYINGLGISGDIIWTELVRRIKGVSGVLDLVLTQPSSNVVALDSEIFRISSAQVTVR